MDISVTTSGKTSAVSTADEFSYMAVTGISPAAGPLAGGTPVTISGKGFSSATKVDFGTTAATNLVVVSGTEITVKSPASSGTVDVTVTGPGGTTTTSSVDQFSFVAAPAVTGVNPITGSGSGGTQVTITGTGFTAATLVDFGTIAATNLVVVSPTEITATSPASTAAAVDVTVTGPGGVSATSSADEYLYYSVVPAASAFNGLTFNNAGFTLNAPRPERRTPIR